MRAHRRRRATQRLPATPMRPRGSGGAGASAALAFLDNVPHCLRRAALHLPLRRSERGLLYFYHGLLGRRESDSSQIAMYRIKKPINFGRFGYCFPSIKRGL